MALWEGNLSREKKNKRARLNNNIDEAGDNDNNVERMIMEIN